SARVWRGYNSAVPVGRCAQPRFRGPLGAALRTRRYAAPRALGARHSGARLARQSSGTGRRRSAAARRLPAPTCALAVGGRAAAADMGPTRAATGLAAYQRRGNRRGAGSASTARPAAMVARRPLHRDTSFAGRPPATSGGWRRGGPDGTNLLARG